MLSKVLFTKDREVVRCSLARAIVGFGGVVTVSAVVGATSVIDFFIYLFRKQ